MLLSVQVQALVTMARIFDVFRDVALLQILCHLLLGDTQGMALALPIDDAFISQPRLPGVRTVLHLLASCKQLMMPHQNVMRQWREQCGSRNTSDDEVIVDDITTPVASSSPEPSDDGVYCFIFLIGIGAVQIRTGAIRMTGVNGFV